MSFLKDTLFYSSSTLAIQVVGFIRGIAVRSILIPEILGIYNLIQVIFGILTVIDFGSSAAAGRELPILRGKNDHQKESLMRGTVLWFTAGQSILVGLGGIIYALIFKSQGLQDLYSYIIVAVLLILAGASNCYQVFYRSAQQYKNLSKVIIYVGVFEAAGYIVGAWVWGINGLLAAVIGMSLVRLLISVIYAKKSHLNAQPKVSFKVVKDLLRFGLPLRIVDYPMQYMVMIDLIWVSKFMDLRNLAIYTTAKLFFTQSNQISISLSTVFETRIIQHFGKTDSWVNIADLIKKYLYFQLLVVVPLLVIISSVLIPFIIRQFLPKYIEGNEAVIYLMLGNFFIVINSGLTIPWYIKKNLISRGLSNVVALTVMLASISLFWFVFGKKDISHVAIAYTVGNMLYFIYMIVQVGKELWSIKTIIRVLSIVLLLVSWIGFVVIAGQIYTQNDLSFISDCLHTVILGLVMVVAISPVPLIGLKISEFRSSFAKLN